VQRWRGWDIRGHSRGALHFERWSMAMETCVCHSLKKNTERCFVWQRIKGDMTVANLHDFRWSSQKQLWP
jgi:hypothetical protein